MTTRSTRGGKVLVSESKEVVAEDKSKVEDVEQLDESLVDAYVAESDDDEEEVDEGQVQEDQVDEKDELYDPDLDDAAVNKKFHLLPEEETPDVKIMEKIVEGSVDEAKSVAELASIKENFEKLFEGENLTKEFKQKVASLFEAAVNIKAKLKVESITKKAVEVVKEERLKSREKIVEAADRLMNHFAKLWFKENRINVVDGVMVELAEGALKATKSYLSTYNVKAPKSRENLIEKLSLDNASFRGKLDNALNENMSLRAELDGIKKKGTIRKLAEGLSDTDKEKFVALAENVSFEDEKSYRTKLKSIREGIFSSAKKDNSAEDFASKMLIEKKETDKKPETSSSTINPYLLG